MYRICFEYNSLGESIWKLQKYCLSLKKRGSCYSDKTGLDIINFNDLYVSSSFFRVNIFFSLQRITQ